MSHSKTKIQNPKFSLPRYDHFTSKPGFFLAQVVGESMNRRIHNGWAVPRNLTFSPASPKAADSNGPHSDGRNVEMRYLIPFILMAIKIELFDPARHFAPKFNLNK